MNDIFSKNDFTNGKQAHEMMLSISNQEKCILKLQRHHHTESEWLPSKKNTNKCWQGCGGTEGTFPYTVVGECILAPTTVENSMEVF